MREEELFAQALEVPEDERLAFLAQACGADRALREGIEKLLEAHETARTPIDEPASTPDELSSLVAHAVDSDREGTADFAPAEGGAIEFGHYVLESEIARGAMGVVYRAEDNRLHRPVALKMIRSALLAGEEEVARFHAEAEAAASLDHPNIVPIYEIGEHDGQHYFTMKLIEGGTLGGEMGTLRHRPKAAARLMATVARALHAAHQRGILHRDLKPGNVLVDEDGEPHLTDFGLAKQLESNSSMTLSGQILGTPYYMAPEQAEGGAKELTTAADVYALGAILYHLLTGRPPHKGDSLMATVKQVISEAPRRPRSIDPSIPQDLETIVNKCLRKDPNRRYSSANGLANDLDRWLRGEPIHARSIPAGERVVKWAKRKPMHAAFWGAAVLFLLTLGVGGPITAIQQAELRKKASEGRKLAEKRAAENRRNLYFAEMNLAFQFGTEVGGIRRLRALTEKWIPREGEEDLRGWEWHHLNSLHRNEVGSFDRHEHFIHSVAWSAGGERIASVDDAGVLRVWNTASMDEVFRADDHARDHARGLVAWSPDQDALACADARGGMAVRDGGTGNLRWSTRSAAGGGIVTLGWRPNGKHVAFGFLDGEVQIRDATTGKVIQRLPGEGKPTLNVSWASVRRLAISHSGASAQIWESSPGRILLEPTGEAPISRASWSPDGRRLAGEVLDGSHDLLIAEPGASDSSLRLQGHIDFVEAVAWSPDGMRLASISRDQTVRVWDAATGGEELVILAKSLAKGIAWAPEGNRIAFGEGRKVRICGLNGVRQSVAAAEHPGDHLQWSPDGTRFATAGRDGTVRIWEASDLTTSRVLRADRGSFYDVSWNPQRNLLAAAGDAGVVWDSETGEERYRISDPAVATRVVRWSPDGSRLAVVEINRDIRIRHAESGEEVAALSSEEFDLNSVRHLEWSPDGKRLAANSFHDGIRIWDTSEFEPLTHLLKGEHVFGAMTWSPDSSRLATGMVNGAIRILDATSGDVFVESLGHGRTISALVWSPDGSRLASGGLDRTIRLWDPATGLQTLALLAHDQAIYDLAWSPDGSRLLSWGADRVIKIWYGGTRPDGPAPAGRE